MDKPDFEKWLTAFADKLAAAFGPRLTFFGLQGSYGRGEQTPESDIDLVVILDEADFCDLRTYRRIIDEDVNADKLCGFVAGTAELVAWDKPDLLSLFLDTRPVLGSPGFLAGAFSADDIRRAVLSGACGIYHAAAHNFLHARSPEALSGLYKAARFVIRAKHYRETGEYVPSMRALAEKAAEEDRRILSICETRRSGDIGGDFDALSEILFVWAGKLIRDI